MAHRSNSSAALLLSGRNLSWADVTPKKKVKDSGVRQRECPVCRKTYTSAKPTCSRECQDRRSAVEEEKREQQQRVRRAEETAKAKLKRKMNAYERATASIRPFYAVNSDADTAAVTVDEIEALVDGCIRVCYALGQIADERAARESLSHINLTTSLQSVGIRVLKPCIKGVRYGRVPAKFYGFARILVDLIQATGK